MDCQEAERTRSELFRHLFDEHGRAFTRVEARRTTDADLRAFHQALIKSAEVASR